MQPAPLNKGNLPTAFYVNRCACGQLVEVPAGGTIVRCACCGQKHVWPPPGSDKPMRRSVRVVK